MTTMLKDDLLDPEVNHDPYPFLARLREADERLRASDERTRAALSHLRAVPDEDA